MAKDKTINFKIESDAKALLEEICKENHTTVSQLLYSFVHQKIKLKHNQKKLRTSLRHESKL